MRIDNEEINRFKCSQLITIKDFINKYHEGLCRETIGYAIEAGKIDYWQPGRERFILLTANTMSYTPQKHSARKSKKII